MIISHSQQFIFFAVPKTATHAIRETLRPHLRSGDWEQQMLFSEQTIPIPAIARLKHGHISVAEIEPVLDYDQWHHYTKFAFVRHPFDRFVSACAFLNRNNPEYQANPSQWMKAALQRPRFRQRLLIRPQTQQIATDNGLAMDFVGRYETLQTSVDTLFERLKFPKVKLATRNASLHRPYQSYLDDYLLDALTEFYARDFALLGYRPETTG